MSRYELSPKAGISGIAGVAVGWDRPLQTFFAQVIGESEGEADDGDLLVWVGTEPGELLTAQAAIDIVAPYARVPDDLAAQLTADMQASIGQKDGPAQVAGKRALFGDPH